MVTGQDCSHRHPVLIYSHGGWTGLFSYTSCSHIQLWWLDRIVLIYILFSCTVMVTGQDCSHRHPVLIYSHGGWTGLFSYTSCSHIQLWWLDRIVLIYILFSYTVMVAGQDCSHIHPVLIYSYGGWTGLFSYTSCSHIQLWWLDRIVLIDILFSYTVMVARQDCSHIHPVLIYSYGGWTGLFSYTSCSHIQLWWLDRIVLIYILFSYTVMVAGQDCSHRHPVLIYSHGGWTGLFWFTSKCPRERIQSSFQGVPTGIFLNTPKILARHFSSYQRCIGKAHCGEAGNPMLLCVDKHTLFLSPGLEKHVYYKERFLFLLS